MLHSGVVLKGRVVDASGKGISETVVGIRSTDRRLLFAFMALISTAVKTDEEGHFQLPPLQGEYELTVGDSKPDYSRQMMLTGNKAPAIEPFRVDVDQADPDKPVILRVESR